MGELDNTIVAFTTDNGAEVITFPDGGNTPFKGGKLTTWEGGMRAPLVVRWPGHIKPGTVKNEIFASLDWVPTLVAHRRWTQGRRAEEADRGREVPGDRQDHARRRRPDRLPRGQVEVRQGHLLLLHRPASLGGPLQELEVLLHDGGHLPDLRPDGRHHLSLDPAGEHQARSVRDLAWARTPRPRSDLAARSPRRARRTSTTGTSCRSDRSCGSRSSRVVRRVPADAGPCQLQPESGPRRGEEAGPSPERVAAAPTLQPSAGWRAWSSRHRPAEDGAFPAAEEAARGEGDGQADEERVPDDAVERSAAGAASRQGCATAG